jgi:hypothetical protein
MSIWTVAVIGIGICFIVSCLLFGYSKDSKTLSEGAKSRLNDVAGTVILVCALLFWVTLPLAVHNNEIENFRGLVCEDFADRGNWVMTSIEVSRHDGLTYASVICPGCEMESKFRRLGSNTELLNGVDALIAQEGMSLNELALARRAVQDIMNHKILKESGGTINE